MSGGGGGSGGVGDSFGPVDDGTPCEQLRFETSLVSPDPAVVSTLAAGRVLDLEIRDDAVAAVTGPGGDVAGYVTDRLRELLRCLQAGKPFEAEVLSVRGGNVRVRVRHAGSGGALASGGLFP